MIYKSSALLAICRGIHSIPLKNVQYVFTSSRHHKFQSFPLENCSTTDLSAQLEWLKAIAISTLKIGTEWEIWVHQQPIFCWRFAMFLGPFQLTIDIRCSTIPCLMTRPYMQLTALLFVAKFIWTTVCFTNILQQTIFGLASRTKASGAYFSCKYYISSRMINDVAKYILVCSYYTKVCWKSNRCSLRIKLHGYEKHFYLEIDYFPGTEYMYHVHKTFSTQFLNIPKYVPMKYISHFIH